MLICFLLRPPPSPLSSLHLWPYCSPLPPSPSMAAGDNCSFAHSEEELSVTQRRVTTGWRVCALPYPISLSPTDRTELAGTRSLAPEAVHLPRRALGWALGWALGRLLPENEGSTLWQTSSGLTSHHHHPGQRRERPRQKHIACKRQGDWPPKHTFFRRSFSLQHSSQTGCMHSNAWGSPPSAHAASKVKAAAPKAKASAAPKPFRTRTPETKLPKHLEAFQEAYGLHVSFPDAKHERKLVCAKW